MKTYKDSASIERDLEILDLERKIALEELKLLKYDYKESLKPINWINSGFKLATKYSAGLILKKLLK
ncbi:DUF6327 family protein [Tamlana sp. I1]|uniref:DUF6327 family protein n=1 Tax=Tamlana sp. I1 TaxID=2762061 RepID=UPI00188F3B0D|nr:DUF6327 family protein [Tamlana sp. I1]